MSRPDSIFLVDDDDAVRHALKLYLEHQDISVHDFSSAEALLETIDDKNGSLLVLDIRMKNMSGLELQTELKRREIDLPVIFITGHGDVQSSVLAMKEGAADFIEKPFENEMLLESIQRAFAESSKQNERKALKASLKARFENLTPREQEVMGYVVDGVSNKQMATLLGVSDRTIEVHRSRVMMKMSATSLPELVRMAVSLGINDTGV